MNYNNNNAIQYLRQYEMFANSLKLINNKEQKSMIVKQLNKLEEKIIALTNESYEEEYTTLANKECDLLDDEKKRITMLIDLINQRLSYVEKRCNDHYQLTGETLDVKDVLGSGDLDELEKRANIIDKYKKNIRLEKELKEEVESLNNKISLASEKMDINKSLNIELENKLKRILSNAFEELGIYNLLDKKEEIEYNYQEIEETLKVAELNYEISKTSPINVLSDCKEMLDDITNDYNNYKEQISFLKLIEIYNNSVDTYEELVEKRKEVNELLKYIYNEEFNNKVLAELTKQYNTILMEKQDINTYDDLILERDRKIEALDEISEENDSEEFKSVLNALIENEKKKEEKLLEEKRKIEEEEKQKRLAIERKRQEEILKRQKLIEDARKKEMEERTKKLLEEQQNSVLQKKKEHDISFESIKDISNTDDINEEPINVTSEPTIEEDANSRFKLELDKIDEEKEENEIFDDSIEYKNKEDIEKELFMEFNSNKEDNKIEDTNKLPNISLDEYMQNFNEKKVEEETKFNFFDDDEFPSIPL